jgi:hypothetical protein
MPQLPSPPATMVPTTPPVSVPVGTPVTYTPRLPSQVSTLVPRGNNPLAAGTQGFPEQRSTRNRFGVPKSWGSDQETQ